MDPSDALSQALHLLQSALALLDQADAPADIGAHLDFTIVRIQEVLDALIAGDSAGRGLPSSHPKGTH